VTAHQESEQERQSNQRLRLGLLCPEGAAPSKR